MTLTTQDKPAVCYLKPSQYAAARDALGEAMQLLLVCDSRLRAAHHGKSEALDEPVLSLIEQAEQLRKAIEARRFALGFEDTRRKERKFRDV